MVSDTPRTSSEPRKPEEASPFPNAVPQRDTAAAPPPAASSQPRRELPEAAPLPKRTQAEAEAAKAAGLNAISPEAKLAQQPAQPALPSPAPLASLESRTPQAFRTQPPPPDASAARARADAGRASTTEGARVGSTAPEGARTDPVQPPAPVAALSSPPPTAVNPAPQAFRGAPVARSPQADKANADGAGLRRGESDSQVLELRKERTAKTAGVPMTPEAWVAKIVALVNDGKRDEAERELVDFRSAFPDADDRLPASLKDWARTIRR